ncbi:nuclear receptor subfamily 4 group A member 3-like isoform X2 [Leptopilina heterotoma]|nr:nuclear receptor subfamily 4 group A member 3-like isoform X2 [Leptopilina heterotoma]XP_043477931.1 nuclear receptor subfamily 4 group A member 3-like isoform X2 [Leptopilina heterotoma]
MRATEYVSGRKSRTRPSSSSTEGKCRLLYYSHMQCRPKMMFIQKSLSSHRHQRPHHHHYHHHYHQWMEMSLDCPESPLLNPALFI